MAPTAVPTPNPDRIRSRSMSPVEIWGIPRQLRQQLRLRAFPDPGEPNKISDQPFIYKVRRSDAQTDARRPRIRPARGVKPS